MDVIKRPITPTPGRDELIDCKDFKRHFCCTNRRIRENLYQTDCRGGERGPFDEIKANTTQSLRDRFNKVRTPHYNRTSWEYHRYEQEEYGKCSYTDHCRFCEKIAKGETITEEDKIDAMTFF